jgi:hypothetical protein
MVFALLNNSGNLYYMTINKRKCVQNVITSQSRSLFMERWVYISLNGLCLHNIMLQRAFSHRRALFADEREMLLAREPPCGDSLGATFQLPSHTKIFSLMQTERWYWPHSFITLRLSLLFSPRASAAENAVCEWKYRRKNIWWMDQEFICTRRQIVSKACTKKYRVSNSNLVHNKAMILDVTSAHAGYHLVRDIPIALHHNSLRALVLKIQSDLVRHFLLTFFLYRKH